VKIVAADAFDIEQLAAVFNAAYEGYFVPMHVDAAALDSMLGLCDIDLSRSCVAVRKEEAVGFVNLGVRGDHGWIGGLGVVPAERRAGVGRALMEAVLANAPRRVTLEVLVQNEPAIRLYEALGFVRTRVLEVWSLTGEVPAAEARKAERRPLPQAGLPWQRTDESLPEGVEQIEVEGGAALIRVNGPRVGVAQLDARDEDAAAELLAAARARGESLHFMNVPEDDPASAALHRLGGTLDLRQYEYELRR
jgi:ribosomal protein S18 acetylase RimI-like enzyme